MSWINTNKRKPKNNQWVVVPFNDGFKAGQYDEKHPFSPVIIDRQAGKFYQFSHWKPLTKPKEPSSGQ